MERWITRLRSFVEHPSTQLATGLMLLISGGTETAYELLDAEKNFRLGVHHGVALFGLIQVVGSLPDIIEGLTKYFHAAEKRRKP
jgi:hypothetical protein